METFASDLSSECLVTDLVHELSSGLEIPFLLSENITAVYKQENVSPIGKAVENSLKEDWTDDVFFKFMNGGEPNCQLKDEVDDDLHSYLNKHNIIGTHSANGSFGSGSGSGSGSESSSTDIWVPKNELYTPPVTPPEERISPENVFFLPSDELKFIPINQDECPPVDNKAKSNLSSASKRVRIQPKPISTTLNIFDSQPKNVSTVMCNVFSDVNSNNIKNGSNNKLLESKIFLNSNNDVKKSVLSKIDFELLQAKRKQERMIRNRESAYLSRKRKKEHVAHLEKQVQDLLNENAHLRLENCSLRQRLAKYEELEPCPVGRKSRNIFKESPKKTTALLALMLTVCFNFGSFSHLINERNVSQGDNDVLNDNLVPVYSNEIKHSRSLLWVDPEFDNLNTTYANLTKTSCPLLINQTESIRLESELRRWIGGDDDYVRPSQRNISKISQYFYSGDKPSKHKNVSKRKYRNRKKGAEMDVYQMKANIFNFDSFFEAIHRRDDTFYLVSFSGDHLLLPALSHNKTSRPKMSLMLPAFLSNSTGTTSDQVEMMQIDCEVTNTQLLSVNENDIPSHMRPYSNSTAARSKNDTKSQQFEEFFLNDLSESQEETEEKLQFEPVKPEKVSRKNQTHEQTQNSKSSEFNSSAFNVDKFEGAQYNLNSSSNNDFRKKKSNALGGVTTKETYNQNSVGFVAANRKNLLKLLVVGPPASNSKAVEVNLTNSFEKSLKNSTFLSD